MTNNHLIKLAVIVITLQFIFTTAHLQAEEVFKTLLSSQPSYSTGNEVKLNFTLTNLSNELQTVLKWGTPLEGFRNNFFQVTKEGTHIPYQGPMIRRGSPLEDDYLFIGAGESISTEIILSPAYDLSVAGDYEVQFVAVISYGTGQFAKVTSNKVTFRIQQDFAAGVLKLFDPPKKCSNKQTQEVTASHEKVNECLDTGLSKITATNEIYQRWFGTADPQKVKDNFSKIAQASKNSQVNGESLIFSCGGKWCEPGDFAYVYPDQNTVYLCDEFWPANLIGYDSKAGVIVHELSHFISTANTSDHVYGQCNAQGLAQFESQLAADNADNHEYFSENVCSNDEPDECPSCCFTEGTVESNGKIYRQCVTKQVGQDKTNCIGPVLPQARCKNKYKCCSLYEKLQQIEGISLNLAGEVIEANCRTKLSVKLLSFLVSNNDKDKIVINWESALETDNVGANLWCAQIRDNRFEEVTKLNSEVIPTKAIAGYGADYSSEDYPEEINVNLKPGIQHCVLEDINADGQCNLHCDHIDTVLVGSHDMSNIGEINWLKASAIEFCNQKKAQLNGACLDQRLVP